MRCRFGGEPAIGTPQRVVLIEEDPENSSGKRYEGSVIWRTETILTGASRTPEIAARAELTIPESKLAVTWSLRRNTDSSLPASDIVEIAFSLSADFPHGGVMNVAGYDDGRRAILAIEKGLSRMSSPPGQRNVERDLDVGPRRSPDSIRW